MSDVCCRAESSVQISRAGSGVWWIYLARIFPQFYASSFANLPQILWRTFLLEANQKGAKGSSLLPHDIWCMGPSLLLWAPQSPGARCGQGSGQPGPSQHHREPPSSQISDTECCHGCKTTDPDQTNKWNNSFSKVVNVVNQLQFGSQSFMMLLRLEDIFIYGFLTET